MTEAPACKYRRINRGCYIIYTPEGYTDGFEIEHERARKKKIEQWYVKVGLPLKPRSTGKRSANTHIHGHATQIGQAANVAEPKSKIIADAVEIAVSMYPDFRMRKDYKGRIVPVTESEPWSSSEAHAVIEALHQIASFCDVTLKEYEE